MAEKKEKEIPAYKKVIPDKELAYILFKGWLMYPAATSKIFNTYGIPKSYHHGLASAFRWFLLSTKAEKKALIEFYKDKEPTTKGSLQPSANLFVGHLIKIGFNPSLVIKRNPYQPNKLHKVFVGHPDKKPDATYDLTLASLTQLLDKVKIPAIENIFGMVVKKTYIVIVQADSDVEEKQFLIICEDREDMIKTVDYLQDIYFP